MRITVVGDVLLDIDLWGPEQRPAPDGGMPIVDVTRTTGRAGGAGLVATLLRGDGHEVRLVSALGSDSSAERLRELLTDVELLSSPSGAPTPVKTRLLAGDESVARIDVGCAPPPAPAVTTAQREALEGSDAIVVADYGRRMSHDAGIRATLARLAGAVPVVWDPHPRGSTPIPGVALVTPNRGEAARFTGSDELDDAARTLMNRWQPRALAITLGPEGVLLLGETGRRLPARRIAVRDGCGAGDRFAASAAAALAEGTPTEAAVRRAIDETGEFLAAGGVASLAAR